MDLLDYYSRKDVQEKLVNFAKGKEITVVYHDKFGKRPDILQYNNDVMEFVKQGATSFHVSEERWKDPMNLRSGMIQKELDELRVGWDCILDIDGPFESSKKTAYLIVEALKFHNVENIGVKFSGNKGFHIGIPFESFPDEVNGKQTKLLFPEGIRVISNYLKNMIKDHLASELGNNDPFSIVDIDSILISSRHMFRMPYSYHDKSGLISIPIDKDKILEFDKESAKIENVKTDLGFLDKFTKNEAADLIIQAFDWAHKKQKKELVIIPEKKDYEVPQVAVKEEFFPPCVRLILEGLPSDGRKRAIFILINFFKHMGWNLDDVQKRLLEWNSKNYEPLREGYIISQISWHKKNKDLRLPPNCMNESYYKSLGICKPDNWCRNIKNPVQQVGRHLKVVRANEGKKKDNL